jgi:hypothetical protein
MKKLALVSVVFLIITILLSACTENPQVNRSPDAAMTTVPNAKGMPSATSATSSNDLAPKDLANNPDNDFKKYFPYSVGIIWSYTIKTGTVRPMFHENVVCTKGGKAFAKFVAAGSINTSPDKDYSLKFSVNSPYQEDKRIGAVEINLIKDGMGIFRYVKGMYWGLDSFNGQAAILQAYDYNISELFPVFKVPSSAGDKATAERIIFIYGKGGIEQEDSQMGTDKFSYQGTDNKVPGSEGITCLYFLRAVKPSNTQQFSGFTEDCWFAPDKGLVRLIQKVDGKTSMTWTLEK